MAVYGYRELGSNPAPADIADAQTAAALIDDYTHTTAFGGLTVAERTVPITVMFGVAYVGLPLTEADFASISAEDMAEESVDVDDWIWLDQYRIETGRKKRLERLLLSARMGYPAGDTVLDEASAIIMDSLKVARATAGDDSPPADIMAVVDQMLGARKWRSP